MSHAKAGEYLHQKKKKKNGYRLHKWIVSNPSPQKVISSICRCAALQHPTDFWSLQCFAGITRQSFRKGFWYVQLNWFHHWILSLFLSLHPRCTETKSRNNKKNSRQLHSRITLIKTFESFLSKNSVTFHI